MTFEDFLESLYARLKRGLPPGSGVPPELAPLGDYGRIASLVEQAHVFLFEMDIDDPQFMQTVGKDALEDLRTTLPLPFDNFAIVKRAPDSDGLWAFTWVLRLESAVPAGVELPADLKDALLLWPTMSGLDGPPSFLAAIAWGVRRRRAPGR